MPGRTSNEIKDHQLLGVPKLFFGLFRSFGLGLARLGVDEAKNALALETSFIRGQ